MRDYPFSASCGTLKREVVPSRPTPTYPDLLAEAAEAPLDPVADASGPRERGELVPLNEVTGEPESLIERARTGDPDAFRELFARHKSRVASVVFRFVGQSAEVDDIVQDVFLQVHRNLHKFRGDSRFTTWLYRVTANTAKMHLRRKASRPRVSPGAEVPEVPRDAAPPEMPDEVFARQQRVDALYRLLARLPEKKRLVIVLHDLEGLPTKEIAEIVESPVVTVRTRLHYARRELLGMLRDEPALAAVVQDVAPSPRTRPPRPSTATASTPQETNDEPE